MSMTIQEKFGENSYGDTPGHISNPEVKPVNAESTWGAAPWEDRNLPSYLRFHSSVGRARDC